LRFSRKRQDGSAPIFFTGFVENTCLFQPALKSTAPGLERNSVENKLASRLLHLL